MRLPEFPFLQGQYSKRRQDPLSDAIRSRVCSIKTVLAGVKTVDPRFRDTILTPELVSFGAVLGIGVSDHVSAFAASKNHDSSHLVMGKFSLVD